MPAPQQPRVQLISMQVLAAQIDALIQGFTQRYARILTSLQDHQEALRRADGEAVARHAQAQAMLLEEVAQLDAQRRELVARACASFPAIVAVRTPTVTLTQMASVLPAPDRTRLTMSAEHLRSLATQVKEMTAAIRAASLTLLTHMEGLLRQVGKQLSHTGTYGRRGVVEAGAAIMSGVDLRS